MACLEESSYNTDWLVMLMLCETLNTDIDEVSTRDQVRPLCLAEVERVIEVTAAQSTCSCMLPLPRSGSTGALM